MTTEPAASGPSGWDQAVFRCGRCGAERTTGGGSGGGWSADAHRARQDLCLGTRVMIKHPAVWFGTG